MITTTIEWHKPTEKLPEKSGYYMAKCKNLLQGLHYSSRHKAFNAFDDNPAESVRAYEIKPIYWAEIPAELETESEDE